MAGESALPPIFYFRTPLSYVYTDHSQLRLYLSKSEVDCFYALLNETLLQQFNVFYASKSCWILLQNNFHASYFVGYSIILLLVFYKLL